MSIEPLVPDLPGYGDVTLISTGSSSLVFRAVQTRLTRTVAIKVLLVDSDAATHAQYERELETTVLLSSQPHIVGIIDTGTTNAGNPYIVMEYCPGGSYAQILKQRGPLPVEEVVDVGMKIAEALQAAHDVGVLHRDVKPSNILRSAFGPALADFGIARAPHLLSTTTSVDRMTPHHASPEAMRKDAQTAASDLYSLASTMWHLLAGQPPFHDPERLDLESLRARVLNDPPPLVPRADVPQWLQQELFRALSKDPEQRHPSAIVFSETLRQYAYRPYYDAQPGGPYPTSAPPTSAPPMPPQGYPGQPVSSQPVPYPPPYPGQPVSSQPVPYPPPYPGQPVSSQPMPYPPPAYPPAEGYPGYPPQYPGQPVSSQPLPYPPQPYPQQPYPQQPYPPPQGYPPAYPPQEQGYPQQDPVAPQTPSAMPPAAPSSSMPSSSMPSPSTPSSAMPSPSAPPAEGWPSAQPVAPRDAFRWPSAAPTRRDDLVEPALPALDPAAREAAAASTILWNDTPPVAPSSAPSAEPSAEPGAEPPAGPAGPVEPSAERGGPDGAAELADDAPRPLDDASRALSDVMKAFNQALGQIPGPQDDPSGAPEGGSAEADAAEAGPSAWADARGDARAAGAGGAAPPVESALTHPTDLRRALSRPTELRPAVDAPISAPPTTPDAVSAPPAPSYPFDPVSAPPVADDRHGPIAFGPSSARPLSGPPLPGSSIGGAAMPGSAIPGGAMPGPSVSSPAPFGQPMSGPPMPSRPLSGSPLQPMSSQPMPGQPMSGLPITGSPMSGMPMSGPPMPGQRSPYDLAGPAQHSEPYAPQPRSGPPDLQQGRPRPDLRWPGESRPRGPLLAIAAGTALVVLLVVIVVVLVHGHGSPVTPTAAGTASSTASGAAGGSGGSTAGASPAPGKPQATQTIKPTVQGAPTDIKLIDNHTSVTVTWKDPSNGTVEFVVLAGTKPANIQLATNALPAGTTQWTQQGLNPSINYCYNVAAVYSGQDVGLDPNEVVCTKR